MSSVNASGWQQTVTLPLTLCECRPCYRSGAGGVCLRRRIRPRRQHGDAQDQQDTRPEGGEKDREAKKASTGRAPAKKAVKKAAKKPAKKVTRKAVKRPAAKKVAKKTATRKQAPKAVKKTAPSRRPRSDEAAPHETARHHRAAARPRERPPRRLRSRDGESSQGREEGRPRTAAKKITSRQATDGPASPRRKITPEAALATTRELLEAKQARDRQPPPWRQFEAPHGQSGAEARTSCPRRAQQAAAEAKRAYSTPLKAAWRRSREASAPRTAMPGSARRQGMRRPGPVH